MFNRTLAAWASDALDLRRRGLDRPSVRRGWWEAGAGEPMDFQSFAASSRPGDEDELTADAA